MIPGKFEYHKPENIEEAIRLLGELGDEAKILAGGHSLLPMMKLRFAEPEHLIDINGIEGLAGISAEGDSIIIGAMTRQSALITSEVLQDKCPLLPLAVKLIADPQVRNRGTLGGNISHGDPANDQPAIMLALNAEFTLRGADGERNIAADDFFLGTYWTALDEGEMLTSISIPAFKPHMGYGFNKLKRKTGDFATAASTVVLQADGYKCGDIRIALTNVGACAFRATEAENTLRGQIITEELIEQAAQQVMAACDPAEDLRGDAEYKSHMAAEMTRRSIKDALSRVGA